MFRVKDPTSWNSNAANTCNAVMEIINLKWMAFAVSWSSLPFMLMLTLVLLLMLKVEMMGKMNGFYGFHKLFCHTVNINEIKNRLSAKALVQCSADSCIWQLSLLALLQLTWLDIHDASLFQLLWHELQRDQVQILHLTWHLTSCNITEPIPSKCPQMLLITSNKNLPPKSSNPPPHLLLPWHLTSCSIIPSLTSCRQS